MSACNQRVPSLLPSLPLLLLLLPLLLLPLVVEVVAQGLTAVPDRLDFGVTSSNAAGQLHWVVFSYRPCPCATSGCPATCSTGSMGRRVLCQQNNGPVADSVCLADVDLADKRPSEVAPCVASVCGTQSYQWFAVTDWMPCPCDVLGGKCTTQCTIGQQGRRVVCQDPVNIVEDALCHAAIAMAGPRLLDITPCQGATCETYAWMAGEWTSCPASALPPLYGQRTRDVSCRPQRCSTATSCDAPAVSDDWCVAADKPSTYDYCIATGVQVPPKWVILGVFKACPCVDCHDARCTQGMSYRRVVCQDPINIVPDSVCLEALGGNTKPYTLGRHEWSRYAHVTRLPVTNLHYRDGYQSQWLPQDRIQPCRTALSPGAHAAMAQGRTDDSAIIGAGCWSGGFDLCVVFRVTMGEWVDYFRSIGTFCDALHDSGQWYMHSYVGPEGPWRAVNGNHGALLLGFTPYGVNDGRVWGPFIGAPAGATGYHAEGGGCCHITGSFECGSRSGSCDAGAIQFWRTFTIDIFQRMPVDVL